MKNKRLQFLISLFMLAMVALALKQYLPSLSFFNPPKLMAFADKDIKSITLTGETKNQTVIQKNGVWYVRKNGADFKADATKMENLLKALHGLTAENIVSRNPEKLADFGIGRQKITVTLPKKTYTVTVGDTYLTNDAYARFGDQKEVFTGVGLGTLYLDGDYRDLTLPILSKTDNVQSVEIDFKGEKTTLIQSGKAWHASDETPVSDVAVQSYLENLATLQANDIIPASSPPETKPELTIDLKQANAKQIRAVFYPGENDTIMFYSGGYSYAIPKVYVSVLEKKKDDFIQPTTQP